MDYSNIAIRIREKLHDEKSKEIFDARYKYMLDGDDYQFFITIKEEKYISKEFDEFMRISGENRDILIYGAGKDGMRTCVILRLCGYKPVMFSDSNSNLYGSEIMGLPIISLDQLVEQKDNYVVVIASAKFVAEIYQKLLFRGIERNYLFYPMHKILTAKPLGGGGVSILTFFQQMRMKCLSTAVHTMR